MKKCFGDNDGMDGSCHYCRENEPDVFEKCFNLTKEKRDLEFKNHKKYYYVFKDGNTYILPEE